MNVDIATTAAVIASPLVAGLVGIVIKRALAKQDAARDRQTSIIVSIGTKVDETNVKMARLEGTVGYHDGEIKRFRELVDRWNRGPRE